MKFTQLHLPSAIQQAINELGFTELTPVQALVLPRALQGRDIAAQGRTGTGKTAAFLIAVYTRLLTRNAKRGRKASDPRALIIAPTRELVIQIARDAKCLGKHSDFKIHAVFGGVDYKKQQRAFEQGVDILIGTPGRLIDYFRKQCYRLKACEMLVIDEADRMFDLGFLKDLRFLLRQLPPFAERQSMLLSATLSYRALELAYEHMNEPLELRAEERGITAEGVREFLYHVAMEEKKPILIALLHKEKVKRGMIFVNEKRTAERLLNVLKRHGFSVGLLSGDVPQKKRLRILNAFQHGRIPLLIATDVASRGLHIEGVSHVFNYDLPQDPQDYVHRIGRTARAGAIGKAVSLSCERFCFSLPEIERYIGHKIPSAAWDPSMLQGEKRGSLDD